jgi:3'-phosphoadenosine 5'-phosphosulfate sulfotransferase (PAPS reductase)/FAD synthetase
MSASTRYVASVSFGKDSLAMLLLILEKKLPLDEVVFYDTGMEFKAIYKIWDFGENHLALKTQKYPHDNFVNNMSKEGYEKMQKALREFLLLYEEDMRYTNKRK